MVAIMKQHNAKILKQEAQTIEYGCNCWVKANCPLERACLTPSLVYIATVNTKNEPPMHYITITEHYFKSRYQNHKLSFNNKKYAASTTLSTHINNSPLSGPLLSAQRPTNVDQNNAHYASRKRYVF